MAKVVMAPAPLAERVEQICAEAEAFIDEKAAADKAGNPLIPIGVLRQLITARDRCACQTVLRLSKPD
jgi:hypothetical protein